MIKIVFEVMLNRIGQSSSGELVLGMIISLVMKKLAIAVYSMSPSEYSLAQRQIGRRNRLFSNLPPIFAYLFARHGGQENRSRKTCSPSYHQIAQAMSVFWYDKLRVWVIAASSLSWTTKETRSRCRHPRRWPSLLTEHILNTAFERHPH